MRPRWPWSRSDWAWSARSCCVSPPSCWTPGFVERATRKRPRPWRARRCSPFSRRSALGPSPSSPGAAAVSLAQPRASGCTSSSPRETQSSSGAQQKEMRKLLPKATLNCQLIYPNNWISDLLLFFTSGREKKFSETSCAHLALRISLKCSSAVYFSAITNIYTHAACALSCPSQNGMFLKDDVPCNTSRV